MSASVTQQRSDDAAPADILATLIRPAADGDRAAMRALLAAVAPVVARAARRVLGTGHSDVEDVAQQALAAFVRRLPHFRGESSIAHFAERIAVYRALSARRDDGARRRVTVPFAPDEIDELPSPPGDTEEAGRRALLLEALDGVPAPQSEALALHFLFDHTVAEIAEILSIPEETVRSRLRRGKQALRAKIVKSERLATLWEEPR